MALKASSRGFIPPFIVMDVMREANQRETLGERVIHMEVGQPSTSAPAGVLNAVQNIMMRDRMGYTDAFGIPRLRQRIAQHYHEQYGVDVSPNNVMVTTGSSGAFILSFLASFDVGDRVALTSPSYPAYRNILAALGIKVIDIPVDVEINFQPNVEILSRAIETAEGKVDGLVIASPSNPTGTMLDPDELSDIVTYCHDQDIRLISDEIYHGITYERPAQTARAYGREMIVISSFSKYFSMTGWRVGWMVVPSDLLRAVECLGQNLFISPPTVSQHAAVASFECRNELDASVARYAGNRTILLDQLPKAGFDQLAPVDGAFYIYADISNITEDSPEFCNHMLAATGVAATPGTDFDPSRGQRFVRFSFSGGESDIEEAVKRLINWRN